MMQIREIGLIDLTTPKGSPQRSASEFASIRTAISIAAAELLGLQHPEGYWWFTLEANEAIGAEFIFLSRFLDNVDEKIEQGICQRILDVQRADGSWGLYKDSPPDLSASIECYFALKLAGYDINNYNLRKAREYILSAGGITKCRVFTLIHLAMFGLVPWSSCPSMPPELILMPNWFPINIYEFSSWARASIVPLLIFMSLKPIKELGDDFNLDELFCEPVKKREYFFKTRKGIISWASFFIHLDKILKVYEKIPLNPFRKTAIKRCYEWTWQHIQRTVDIYPAMAYGTLAFKAMGYENNSEQIKVPFEALKSFQQSYATLDTPLTCYEVDRKKTGHIDLKKVITKRSDGQNPIHQQCCISPCWDTPWTLMALLESGVPATSPSLLKAGRWLLSKQIKNFKGDWAVKNPKAEPGGWPFEFKNDYFPDIDDTIEIISVLSRLAIPQYEKEKSVKKAMAWLLSMQNKDGGWGAFDKNQNCKLVNEIPFSDHGACLDPSTPDITGRMIELLATHGMTANDEPVRRALKYIADTQESFGGWFGRWGINYIYGTWCVLTGLSELGFVPELISVQKATRWLKQIQNEDGGFGESPESYRLETYVKWKESTASQTAWALMALVAGGEASSEAARRAATYLIDNINETDTWDEEAHTGTGFPGHFYIRYHGYRNYFPLLALARYYSSVVGS